MSAGGLILTFPQMNPEKMSKEEEYIYGKMVQIHYAMFYRARSTTNEIIRVCVTDLS